MKKIYKTISLLILLVILSTYNSNKESLISKKKNNFFSIKDIAIENNFIIRQSEIKKKIKHIYNKNIFFINKEDIEIPLKIINFLDRIEVKKKYPDKIIIKIIETKPMAKLVKNNSKYILDSSSNLILNEENDNFKNLPNIFGKNSENNFMNFFKKLKKNNFPIKKILNFYYFQIDRWDIQLIDKKIIKLPYSNIDDAIVKSIDLMEREDFKNYNTIDLRIDGKIIVE